ncbi:Chromatin target of PRMT1 protein [Orchesella cincta]|uniref:Chromatin target of PRMT1 protein n=1 Tax=Orchesella cincta TaxID=48709 RepID=A0A1D2MNW4_ORCCI|nr:Chromatin target of PRMT1 protein [Orchesella cincta]
MADRRMKPLSTGISLSQRFQRTQPDVVQHRNSPFRMDLGIGGNTNGTVGGFEVSDDNDDLLELFGKPTLTSNHGLHLQGSGSSVTNNGILLAAKEAEIRRLRSQLTLTKARLIIATNEEPTGAFRMPTTSAFKGNGTGFVQKRAGGGVQVGQHGIKLNMTGKSKASQLFAKSKPGFTPLKRKATGAGPKYGGTNAFGKPKSKEDLDADLDAYMSKSKGKKTDLDKELDEYMKARQETAAAKVDKLISATTITASPIEDTDATMELL